MLLMNAEEPVHKVTSPFLPKRTPELISLCASSLRVKNFDLLPSHNLQFARSVEEVPSC
jgi:hypothetical protein